MYTRNEKILPIYIEEEMRNSYINYAMSVIVGRALPDIRDGLKPVHRRILYAMKDMGIVYNKPYKKSARIVGEVLGKYHPHGDTAVYDSLVRMVQDFSLRYPLINGQGNFGCFTKDTKVKSTDGRSLTFGELIEEHNNGKKNYTYTINSLGLISIAEIKNPRLTKKKAELIKIILDNGQKIKCTPNHLFMLKDGTYREAQNLSSGDSLMPLYQKISEKTDQLNREGYLLINQPKTNIWIPAHHLADNYNLTHGKYQKSAGRVRHHIDFNKLNNNPDNITRMQWGDHWKIHYLHAINQHKNPEYRANIASGRKRYWADPINRAKKAGEISVRNIENWKNRSYREKMKKLLSDATKKYIANHPEKRKELSVRLTQTLKRQWQDPGYRALMREKIVKANKNHTTNKTGKLKFINVCKETLKKYRNLDENYYEKTRSELYPYGAATLWGTGLEKYFQNDPSLIYKEINNNHKVVGVEKIKEREDVYDLTIDETHNFALAAGVFVHNSIDGDTAAAMRYTEARLHKIADFILQDLEKDTVEWQPNFDGSLKEPNVLPSVVPNLLVNGSSGIAVGMATNIPPHNLAEIVDAICLVIDNPKCKIEELIKIVKGPDFPTGALICGREEIVNYFKTGRGRLKVHAKAHVESKKQGKESIVITEIPYQVSKSRLITSIVDLVKDKKIDGISDIRDESDRDGMRVVIDVRKGANAEIIMNQLYKHTQMAETFGVIMLALVNNEPKILNLKEMLVHFIDHRKDVIIKRTKYDLARAEERAHILEGLKVAIKNLDEVIRIIKKSESPETAKEALIKKFKFSEAQALAILAMRLQQLTNLETQKIEDEYKELIKLIETLKGILASEKKVLAIIKDESLKLKETFGDARRTEITAAATDMNIEDLIAEEDMVTTLSHAGYIKRFPVSAYRKQRRGGTGVTGAETKEEDFIEHLFIASTHDYMLIFTTMGKLHWIKVHEIPQAGRRTKGKPIVNLLDIEKDENITSIVPVREFTEGSFVVMVTERGKIKKTDLTAFSNPRKGGIIAITLEKNDRLISSLLSNGGDEICLATNLGKSIRFKESDIRAMGRGAQGVKGISLRKGDRIIGMVKVDKEGTILTVTQKGFGKRTEFEEYRMQSRGGSGIINMKIVSKNGPVVGIKSVREEDDIMLISRNGMVVRVAVKGISKIGRATQGVRVINLKPKDELTGIASVARKEDTEDSDGGNDIDEDRAGEGINEGEASETAEE